MQPKYVRVKVLTEAVCLALTGSTVSVHPDFMKRLELIEKTQRDLEQILQTSPSNQAIKLHVQIEVTHEIK